MSIGFSYKNDEKIFTEKVENGVPYLEYPLLADTGLVRHGFSTRLGGVSEGVCSTMNLSFSRGDDESAVRENYRRMANAIGVEDDSFVFSMQTHTTNIRVVTSKDKGKGLTTPLDYSDVDGLVTDEPGLCPFVFLGSGEKSDRSKSFRLERNCRGNREKDSGSDAKRIWMSSRRYLGGNRTVYLSDVL